MAKKGLPAVFSCTSSGQRRGALRRALQRIGDQPPDVVEPERRQHDLLHLPPALRIAASLRISGCAGVDLVVPIGADQQQVAQLRLGRQVLEQVERRRVQPLQVVEEQRQRMLRPGEHAEQAAEHQLEAALRVLRRQFRRPAAAGRSSARARGSGRP